MTEILQLRVKREIDTSKDFTPGGLFIDGVFECYTLEDEYREVPGQPVWQWKRMGSTAIPKGNYRILLTWSPHFNRTLPLLLSVPAFDGVRIHPGNTNRDTEGCILVGDDNPHSGFLGHSRQAFDRVLEKMRLAILAGKEIWIKVE